MIYYVEGKPIDIPIEKKCFSKGSEGKVYKIENDIYKIYYPNMINEGYGLKKYHHARLLTIPTKQIILPTAIIYDEKELYSGYKTPFIEGDQKNKTGITKMPSDKFIKNLQILESDFALLTENYILAADVSPINYIYNDTTHIMSIIDPGRYKSKTKILQSTCKLQNEKQLATLIELLLYLDFIEYKPVGSKRKSALLRDYIKTTHQDKPYSEFFSKELQKHENVHEYAKSLEKYIK